MKYSEADMFLMYLLVQTFTLAMMMLYRDYTIQQIQNTNTENTETNV